MDTVEQLNRKYFFDGISVDKDELLYWLIFDEFKNSLVVSPICWPSRRY